jgi:hypothetical protein
MCGRGRGQPWQGGPAWQPHSPPPPSFFPTRGRWPVDPRSHASAQSQTPPLRSKSPPGGPRPRVRPAAAHALAPLRWPAGPALPWPGPSGTNTLAPSRSPARVAMGPHHWHPRPRACALTPPVLILAVYLRSDGWERPTPLRFAVL